MPEIFCWHVHIVTVKFIPDLVWPLLPSCYLPSRQSWVSANNGPKDVHALIPGTFEYVIYMSKGPLWGIKVMDLHIRRLFQSIWAGAGGRADVIAKILHSGCERQKKDRCNALPSILPLCPPGLISVVPFHPSYLVSPYILCFIISLCYFIDTFIRLLFYM